MIEAVKLIELPVTLLVMILCFFVLLRFILQKKSHHWDRWESIQITGHLKTLGAQMGYPIGILTWVVMENNYQTHFQFVLLSWRC